MNLTTCLWSPDNNALEMAEYYVLAFPDSQITTKWIYDEANPHLPGSKAWDIMMVEFTLLESNKFATLNGGPYFKHSCAVSFMISCKNQDELDYYYTKLSAVPEAEQCGWVTDKFGVSWQLIPTIAWELSFMISALAESNQKELSFSHILLHGK